MKVTNFFEYTDAVGLLNSWGDGYSKGTSPASDAEYDALYREVLQWEKENPGMVDKESPTRKVWNDSTEGFVKVDHKFPMLSIANSNGYDELEEWVNKTLGSGVTEFVSEFKIDGLALSLIYQDGNLEDAVTRGNGKIGDSVIANARQIKSIPQRISGKGSVEVRGEVVWLTNNFLKFQSVLELEGKDPMANPRNGAAGTMKQKDPLEVGRRVLDFIAYSIVDGSPLGSQSEDLDALKRMGFYVSDHYIGRTVNEILKTAHLMESQRESLSFITDGLVIKTNNKKQQKALGGTTKTPNFLTALKFPPLEKETELLDVELSYGRTGAVTPVAILKPIQLAGTVVQRASLHNWDVLEFLGLHKGCKVIIRKAGEIIPECVGVAGLGVTKTDYELFTSKNISKNDFLTHVENFRKSISDKEWIKRPDTCKHCNTRLINPVNKDGKVLVSLECPNQQCPIKQFKAIVRFVSKEAMDIFGVDESIVESLLNAGLIKNITDLYSLKKSDVLKMDGFKDRSADKLLSAIDNSRKAHLHQLLVGFGIPNCGKTLSDKLATEYDKLDVIASLTESDLLKFPDVGPETASSIVKWFHDNKTTVQFFSNLKVGTTAKAGLKVLSSKLTGLSLIMSGTSDVLDRDEFKNLVKQHGGKVVSSVSGKLNFFVEGEDAGPEKKRKVDELNASGSKIQKIAPEDFLKMIE